MRKTYLQYLKQGIQQNGLKSIYQYPSRYLGTLASYFLKKSLSGPIEGDLCLTYNCNLRCIMCDLPQRHQGFVKEGREILGLEDYKQIIRDYRKIGTSGVGISGGEPFLHKDLFPIIREIKDNKMIAQITTNGWFIREKNFEEFIDTGIDSITVSLDGHNAEIHDKIRGIPGSFDRALHGIDLVANRANRNYKVNINTVLSEDNIGDFPAIIEMAKKSGADSIGFMPVHTIGSDKTSNPELKKDREEKLKRSLDRLCEEKRKDDFIESSIEYLEMFESFFLGKPLPIKCYAGYTTVLVDCYGDIFPCFTFYETKRAFANIRDTGGLANYWHSQDLKEKRDGIRDCRECYWNCQVETNLLYKYFEKIPSN